MAEYIKREDAVNAVMAAKWVDGSDGAMAMEIVASPPAADVAPVMHGRWLTHYRSGVTVAEGFVSSCCDMWAARKSHYCPNCGAKMDGGATLGKGRWR